ncbi:MAG: FAD-dependent oxidoreductase, partial [Armatimonadota bacterium]|nr:FAD-dependent oxidoreductase [Armatimonadota bacterium]
MKRRRFSSFLFAPWASALCALIPLTALAQDPIPRFAPTPPHPPSATGRRVLDMERLTAVTAPRFPNEVPTCQVLILGGGVGGVAAAEALVRQGVSVILTEPTSHLGGQFTAQGLGVPDENRFIEQQPGPSTLRYRELRQQVRDAYARTPGVKAARADNVGQCWVSRVSGVPGVWEDAIDARLTPLVGPSGIRRVLLRHQLLDIQR